MENETLFFKESVFSVLLGMMSCSITRIFWKLTNTWFQQLFYQILKGNNLYSMFFSYHFPALCQPVKALLSLWVMSDTKIFQNTKVSRGFVWLNSCHITCLKAHISAKTRTTTSTSQIFPPFFFNLSSLKWHLSTSLLQLVQAKLFMLHTKIGLSNLRVMREASISPEVNWQRWKQEEKWGIEWEPGYQTLTSSI